MSEQSAAELDLEHKCTHLTDSRTVMQCIRSLGEAWRLTWQQGGLRSNATNALAPLDRLIARKTANLSVLYEDGSDEQQVYAAALADLMWRRDVIAAAMREEGL